MKTKEQEVWINKPVGAYRMLELSVDYLIFSVKKKPPFWYDNEWGYSNRVVDLVRYISKK